MGYPYHTCALDKPDERENGLTPGYLLNRGIRMTGLHFTSQVPMESLTISMVTCHEQARENLTVVV